MASGTKNNSCDSEPQWFRRDLSGLFGHYYYAIPFLTGSFTLEEWPLNHNVTCCAIILLTMKLCVDNRFKMNIMLICPSIRPGSSVFFPTAATSNPEAWLDFRQPAAPM